MQLDNSSDSFIKRHLGLTEEDEKQMLKKLGFDDIDNFITKVIPEEIQSNKTDLSSLPKGCSEREALDELKSIASLNDSKRSLIGLGYFGTHTPHVIKRHILENPRWYTAYTPYQAEISQGRLEALFNFQTLICELTGFNISNSSLLDEGTAAAEAMSVAFSTRKNRSSNTFLVHESVYEHTYNVLLTRARPLGIKLERFNSHNYEIKESDFGILIQLPGKNGEIFDPTFLISKAHNCNVCVCTAIDPLAQVLIKPIAHFGVDIAIGTLQRFGVPIGFGGPHAAFFACKDKYKRFVPGRIVGETISKDGEKSLRLALQTREQHIRREKATSNICTAQSLLAIISSFYAIYHGSSGLVNIARRIVIYRRYLERVLSEIGLSIKEGISFDTFEIYTHKAVEVHQEAVKNGFNFKILPLGEDIENAKGFGISLDELTNQKELEDIINFISTIFDVKIDLNKFSFDNCFHLEGIPLRKGHFMQQRIFQDYQSETDLMRYIFKLSEKDF